MNIKFGVMLLLTCAGAVQQTMFASVSCSGPSSSQCVEIKQQEEIKEALDLNKLKFVVSYALRLMKNDSWENHNSAIADFNKQADELDMSPLALIQNDSDIDSYNKAFNAFLNHINPGIKFVGTNDNIELVLNILRDILYATKKDEKLFKSMIACMTTKVVQFNANYGLLIPKKQLQDDLKGSCSLDDLKLSALKFIFEWFQNINNQIFATKLKIIAALIPEANGESELQSQDFYEEKFLGDALNNLKDMLPKDFVLAEAKENNSKINEDGFKSLVREAYKSLAMHANIEVPELQKFTKNQCFSVIYAAYMLTSCKQNEINEETVNWQNYDEGFDKLKKILIQKKSKSGNSSIIMGDNSVILEPADKVKQFQQWVRNEVLPGTLQKNGGKRVTLRKFLLKKHKGKVQISAALAIVGGLVVAARYTKYGQFVCSWIRENSGWNKKKGSKNVTSAVISKTVRPTTLKA